MKPVADAVDEMPFVVVFHALGPPAALLTPLRAPKMQDAGGVVGKKGFSFIHSPGQSGQFKPAKGKPARQVFTRGNGGPPWRIWRRKRRDDSRANSSGTERRMCI